MSFPELKILIRGGGEIASGIAHRLMQCHFGVCLTEIERPLAVRREVAFCEAVYEGEKEVEGVVAILIQSPDKIFRTWRNGKIPILVDPDAKAVKFLQPDVVIDAIIAKKNLGTRTCDAPLVIGVGPGFEVNKDVHIAIETNRGHDLGRVILHGQAQPDTGIPGEIGGFSSDRVLRSPKDGWFSTNLDIGDQLRANDTVAYVDGIVLKTPICGILRGLLRNGSLVCKGMKVGDVDPRGIKEYCYTISDKSRAIAGGVIEAILSCYNIRDG